MANRVGKYDLEERLINFVIAISEITEQLPNTKLGNQIGNQIIRSGSAPALNYAEAMASESGKDFIHKLKIVLKELRETMVCLKIIRKKPLITDEEIIDRAYNENNELISIFYKSIETAKRNQIKTK